MTGSTRYRLSAPRLRQIAVNTEPLRNPDFRRLFFGQGIAFIGFQVTAAAVPVQMYAITRSSSLWVGLLGVAALVPLVAFGLYGGAIADVVDRRRLYIAASCVLWAVTGAFLLQALLHAHSAWILLALMAAQSTGFAVVAGPWRDRAAAARRVAGACREHAQLHHEQRRNCGRSIGRGCGARAVRLRGRVRG